MNKELLTRKQIADYCSVKPLTVRKWQRLGKLMPHCRLNGRPRYRLQDVEKLLTDKTNP